MRLEGAVLHSWIVAVQSLQIMWEVQQCSKIHLRRTGKSNRLEVAVRTFRAKNGLQRENFQAIASK